MARREHPSLSAYMSGPVEKVGADGPQQRDPEHEESSAAVAPMAKGLRFWGIFTCLCILAFISALYVAMMTTALPTIVSEVGGATNLLADVLGRRTALFASIALFLLGSRDVCGATGPGMLIAGRDIQGAGAGGINVLIDIVCCGLVPVHERGKYLGLIFSWACIAAALGPPVGGALAESGWRWIFYMNLSICGVVMIALALLMRGVKTGSHELPTTQTSPPDPTTTPAFRQPLSLMRQLDVIGNLIFIPGMGSLWAAFHAYQTVYARYPSVPSYLLASRTSAAAFVLTFTSSIILQVITYFFLIYLQAVQGKTVLESGTYFLHFAIPSIVFAVAGGILLSKFGAYRPLHAVAFAIMTIATGVFTLLVSGTSMAAWVILRLIASADVGLVIPSLLPTIMASLLEKYVAASSAAYSFVRSFGYIWGVTLSAIIFNEVFDDNMTDSQVPRLRESNELPTDTLNRIVTVFVLSLRAIWYFCMAISIVSFFVVGMQRGPELRTELDTQYGIDGCYGDQVLHPEVGPHEKNDLQRYDGPLPLYLPSVEKNK
ncbi:major facilitator superfamily domain-containing protein [Stachybotrys elegans]|uniref:Major facilitator superfamily domain-containing protein n=1 Tax=Stachybotrys elegans TaxID=80388 RepID=A0A8K0T1Y1_9HYPO|nr:major facilitator superfamily domain-containing protein [Stachybotrys elegans]